MKVQFDFIIEDSYEIMHTTGKLPIDYYYTKTFDMCVLPNSFRFADGKGGLIVKDINLERCSVEYDGYNNKYTIRAMYINCDYRGMSIGDFYKEHKTFIDNGWKLVGIAGDEVHKLAEWLNDIEQQNRKRR